MVARLFIGVPESININQQNRLFRFLKTSCFYFLENTQGCLGRSQYCKIDFSSDYGPETKGAKKCYRTYICLFFREDYRILKLRVIYRCTRSSFNVQNVRSILVPPHFVCSGDSTKQIIILKTKIKPVSINAAANCNEHIL